MSKLDIVENDLSESALDAGVENVDCARLVKVGNYQGVRICDFSKFICCKILAASHCAENCRRRSIKRLFFLGGGGAQNLIGAWQPPARVVSASVSDHDILCLFSLWK
jgi:hypothetical protein